MPLVTALLERGASVHARDHAGRTARLLPSALPVEIAAEAEPRLGDGGGPAAGAHRSLHETTTDGGIVCSNVPPGEYVLTAAKAGVRFTEVRVKCRAGVLVNAAPPYGSRRSDGRRGRGFA